MDHTIKRILGEALPPYSDGDDEDPEAAEDNRRWELEQRMKKILQAGFHIAGLEIAVDEAYPVGYDPKTNEAEVTIEIGLGLPLSKLEGLRKSGLADGDYTIEPHSNLTISIKFQMAKDLVTGRVKPNLPGLYD